MKIVVDTNIVFSAMLNTNSRIAQILLQPQTNLTFYSTEKLLFEIEENSGKLKELSGYSDMEFGKVFLIYTRRLKFIDVKLIPKNFYLNALELTQNVDIDDTEFVALTDHLNGKFWSGDKKLKTGLIRKNWTSFVSTEELFSQINRNE